MKKSSKLLSAGFSTVMILAAGCCQNAANMPENTVALNSGCQNAAKPVVSPTSENTRVSRSSNTASSTTCWHCSSKAGALNTKVAGESEVKLKVAFSFPAEYSFCRKLAGRLANAGVWDNAEVVFTKKADAYITFSTEFEEKDKDAGYYRVICRQITAAIAVNGRIYSMRTIMPAELPRQQGLDNAKNQYLVPAAEQLAPIMKRELEKFRKEKIAVRVVDFVLASKQLASGKRVANEQSAAEQIERIVQALRSTAGVINFENIYQDVKSSRCSFRVVYFKEQIPQGLTNVLNIKLAAK